MFGRIYSIFKARNLEFIRDRASLSWNIVLPVALVIGLSFVFGGEGRTQFTVGVLQAEPEIDTTAHAFLQTRFVDFVVAAEQADAIRKVSRHQLDLLVRFSPDPAYWVNPGSPRGYFAEKVLLESDSEGLFERQEISGDAVRYVDWVLPGILGMNMMFSCLFGVGYVVVRYRKNGFLKRLNATPLRPLEFVLAQLASRLLLILTITSFVYLGTHWILDTRMEGSHVTLFIVALVGSTSLVSMGLVIAARVNSEELAGGLLNMATWPMMLLSGVWFSLEAATPWVQQLAKIFPLTHILDAARAVMLDGASLSDIGGQLTIVCVMTVIFLATSAFIFRWRPQ